MPSQEVLKLDMRAQVEVRLGTVGHGGVRFGGLGFGWVRFG